MKRIGVLALQGAFTEHISLLRQLGVDAIPIRLPRELNGLDGLVIPGGESTTIGKLMHTYGFTSPLKNLISEGLPVLGTCAGMILLAKQVHEFNGHSLGVMDMQIRRNAFGRQVDSFEAYLTITALGEQPFPAVFIRAPRIECVGPDVEILAQLPDARAVAARQDNVIATAFHPELTRDVRFHAYFLSLEQRRQ